MGFKFDEKTLVNNNIFKYEDKLNSSYTRFLDKTPTYVTYYNINTIESTVDLGFSNVEKILGIEIIEGEYDTLAGYLIEKLGRIPKDNEKPVIETKDATYKIEKVKDKKIIEVKACKNKNITE